VIPIALAAAAATCTGLFAERHWPLARRATARMLRVMLYVLVPFVSYVSIAHLHVTFASTIGLGVGWVAIGISGLLAGWVGRSALHLPDGQLGAFIVCVVVANTGYLGNPVISALLGAKALRYGVAWDQLVSSPALFLLGFGVGAHFGHGTTAWRTRASRFITRNPPLWAAIAGLIAKPQWAPAPLPAISHGVVDALLVCGFLAAGVYLSSERRDEHVPIIDRPDRPVVVAILIRLTVAPLLLVGVSTLAIGLPTAYIIQAMMPTGLNTLVVGHAYELDLRMIASTIVWTSLIVIVVALVIGVV
jgi:predicted permease